MGSSGLMVTTAVVMMSASVSMVGPSMEISAIEGGRLRRVEG
jgi:hypothetical protein